MEQNQYNNWIICLDPDSNQIYSLNLTNNRIFIETKVDPLYRIKAKSAYQDLQNIIYSNPNTAHWFDGSQEIDDYRRRPIPSYLLHPKPSQYPRFLAESDLSFAFANIHSIQISGVLIIEGNTKIFALTVSLMTSADESIKLILNELHLKNDHNYILQVAGYQEYIYGSYPLMQFNRIRALLRDTQHLETILIENNIKEIFDYPAIYQRSTIENIQPITQWQNYLKIPIFSWYPPFKLPKYNQEEIDLEIINQQQQLVDQYYKQFIKQQRIVKNTLYSGECDFAFSFQILAVQGILQLFESDFSALKIKRATYNGVQSLYNITKTEQPGMQNQNKNNQKSKQDILILNNKKLQDDGTGLIRKTNQLNRIAYGGNEYRKAIIQMQQQFGLDFEPYLISIKVSIYYGDSLLSPNSFQESKKVPFNFFPKFNYTIKFPQLKISQLPYETRLCFEILIYSSDANYQIIGSTTHYIFDHHRLFKQGQQILNLWPFYKIDPRMMCQQEFRGIVVGNKHYQSARFQKYSQLIIKMDQFCDPMKYSIRNSKKQNEIGSFFDCLNTKFYADLVRSDPQLQRIIENKKNPEFASRQSALLLATQYNSLGKRKGLSQLEINSQLQQNSNQNSNFVQQILQNRATAQYFKQNNDRLGINYPLKDIHKIPQIADLAYLQTLIGFSPIDRMKYTIQDKYIMMICRHHYKTIPNALQQLLLSINWADPKQLIEGHKMINDWIPLPPEMAIILLDAHFVDEQIRLYAVKRLSVMQDDQIVLFMLQLSQALLFEKNHHSVLGEFLLERCSKNPFTVGHELFWLLKSQLHIKPTFSRNAVLLEQMLMVNGKFREAMAKEVMINQLINQVALKVKDKSTGHEMHAKHDVLKQEISNVQDNIQRPFTIPLDSRMQVFEFVADKCRVLNSKKLPLYLYMSSHSDREQKQLQVIFKNGDDLRQDLLTLQIIRIIDKIWLDAGLDFKMQPYKVISTDDQVGLIEVVLDSRNISAIHEESGKLGAFDEKAILNFIKMHNSQQEEFEIAKDNFLRSCAGYCVATYVLGIGDRHSGNIMLKRTGHIFHIDFGHFLGHFKSKFGINRERAKFVLTPEMAFVMGGQESESFQKFEQHCINAYNLIRKHGKWFIELFLMNLSAGIPELQTAGDVMYLQEQLALNLSEQEATAKFRQELVTSLNDLWRPIDNFFHTLVRKG